METGKKPLAGVSFEECLRRVLNGEYECHHTPDDPMETGEIMLGTLENGVARSTYSLWREMAEGAKRFEKNLPDDDAVLPKDEIVRLQCQAHQLHNRVKCARAIFWELVYSDFPKARDPGVSVAVRNDWAVVIFKASHPFFDMLRELGGDQLG